MRLLFTLISLLSLSTAAHGWTYSGKANTWFLYETDNISSASVALVYDTTTAPPTLIGVAVGKDISIECAKPNRSCSRRSLEGEELKLERVTEDANGTIQKDKKAEIGGDALFYNLGINAKAKHDEWALRAHGNFTTSLMEQRALLGSDKYRFNFYELYGQRTSEKFKATAGRKPIVGGVLVDGVTADLLLGSGEERDSKTLGLFLGTSPDPISKNPSSKYLSFGSSYRFIPDFSAKSETKFLLEGSLLLETYKGSVNRFNLFNQAHFTPIRSLSFFAYSTLELPWQGDDADIKSTHFSLQAFYRPSVTWNFLLGFSQFRIDRHLQEKAVQWVTDSDSLQSKRVGDSLDRSHRYRIDFRTAYKPLPFLQPFVRLRYERRTFDNSKSFDNAQTDPPGESLTLLNQKNSYQGTTGVRLFFLDRLETETSAGYARRYQSKGYDIFQSAAWESPSGWGVDIYGQLVNSKRTQNNSVPGGVGTSVEADDYYIGLGGSYRFLSDFLGQIRYDLASEQDVQFSDRVSIHTVLLRLDYSF